jgi:hypothetical protein
MGVTTVHVKTLVAIHLLEEAESYVELSPV